MDPYFLCNTFRSGMGALHIYTENSEYLAKYCEHDALDKRVLRRALRDYLWPDDVLVFNKIKQSEDRKQMNKKSQQTPDDFRTCAILTFSSDILNHFVSLELRQGRKSIADWIMIFKEECLKMHLC